MNHTAHVSGAEQSLLSMLAALPPEVEPVVACPDGPLARALAEAGVATTTVPGTDGSLKLHPWRTARAVGELAAEGASVRRLARGIRADLVHANSIRAGLAVCAAGSRAPALVQVRDCLPPGIASKLSHRLIGRRSALVLANSRFTERCFARDAPDAPTAVLHSPVDLSRFDPSVISRDAARERLDLPLDAPVLAVLAQITPWKGQDDAVRLVAALRERFPGVRLLLVGAAKFVSASTRYDNVAYMAELERLIADLGLERDVTFLGERTDVPEILRALDVLLVPSWEEPFGRTVVEAMAMEVPVLATREGGPAESIRDGVDGFLLPPRDPDAWVAPAVALLSDPAAGRRMGAAARARVHEHFSAQVLGARLQEHYEAVLAQAR